MGRDGSLTEIPPIANEKCMILNMRSRNWSLNQKDNFRLAKDTVYKIDD